MRSDIQATLPSVPATKPAQLLGSLADALDERPTVQGVVCQQHPNGNHRLFIGA